MIRLLCLLFSTVLFGQFKYLAESDLQRMNLSDKVKEVKVTYNYFSGNTQSRYSKTIFTFNDKGKIVSEENFMKTSNGDEALRLKKVWKYNEKGQPISLISTYDQYENISDFKYEYDTIIKTEKSSEGSVTVTKYVYKKNIEYAFEISADVGNTEKSEGVYKYDHRNRIVESKDLIYKNGQTSDSVAIKSTYKRKCPSFVKQDFGKFYFKNVLNRNCDVIKSFQFTKDDQNPKRETRSSYIYDKNRNWIEKKDFNGGNELISITTRQITYYK